MSKPPENTPDFRPTPIDDDDLLGDFDDAGANPLPDPPAGTVGFTHFDAPGSADDEVTVLLVRPHLDALVPGAMVRIESAADPAGGAASVARQYQGVVTAGPYAEPDALAAGSPIAVGTTLGGKARVLLPNYHGRCVVRVTAEHDGLAFGPPRHRPRPSSAVVPLGDAETAASLRFDGDVPLGSLLGNANVRLNLDTAKKHQLPRHTAILGTTGGGKSNTVATLVAGAQRGGASVVILDVEGEYVDMDRPCDNPPVLALLEAGGLEPAGLGDFRVLHPVGRETARESGAATPFSLRFEDLSPYAAMDLLDLTDAQQTRFLKAYDVLKGLMKALDIFPVGRDDYDRLVELDEFDGGYPKMTLAMLRDVIQACADRADREGAKKGDADPPVRPLVSRELKPHEARVRQDVAAARPPGHFPSWMALLGKLNRIVRLGLFDSPRAAAVDPSDLTAAGRVTVIDLSDTDSPTANNLIIANLLRGVQRRQEADAKAAVAAGERPSPTLVVIEEAHEFLSAARIRQQPHLQEQVARIAKRGRKRWLGLVFVTQLPQQLPDEALALVNNHVLHAIRDPGTITRLSRQVPGLDEAQWRRLPSLAPGQAVVSLATAARPVLAQIDPAACRLRLAN